MIQGTCEEEEEERGRHGGHIEYEAIVLSFAVFKR